MSFIRKSIDLLALLLACPSFNPTSVHTFGASLKDPSLPPGSSARMKFPTFPTFWPIWRRLRGVVVGVIVRFPLNLASSDVMQAGQ